MSGFRRHFSRQGRRQGHNVVVLGAIGVKVMVYKGRGSTLQIHFSKGLPSSIVNHLHQSRLYQDIGRRLCLTTTLRRFFRLVYVIPNGQGHQYVQQSHSVLYIRYTFICLSMTTHLYDGSDYHTFWVHLVGQVVSPPLVPLISVRWCRLSNRVRSFVVLRDSSTYVRGQMTLQSIHRGVHLVHTGLCHFLFTFFIWGDRFHTFGFPHVCYGHVLVSGQGASYIRLLHRRFPNYGLYLQPHHPVTRFFINTIFFRPFHRVVKVKGVRLLSMFLLRIRHVPLLSIVTFVPSPMS